MTHALSDSSIRVAVVGGGLAGCECAYRLARAGVLVTLFEMKPHHFSPAHSEDGLAELVCSNSFRSDQPDSAVGLLKAEMRSLDSLTMQVAQTTRVPAGKALAVDRERFSREITRIMESTPGITLERKEIPSLDASELNGYTAIVIAAGPLASESLGASLAQAVDATQLYFYDAIAPIISADSVDMSVAFWGSRYQPEDNDYLNCPMSRDEYFAFHAALLAGEKAPTRNFEKEIHFEGCMPIEAMAERGEMTLAFGPFKPVGFTDPRTGERPFALVQLRAEDLNKSMFNLVGCQTKLKYGEQDRIFRMIPGLEHAEFVRYGSVHRNTYVNAPRVLNGDLSLKTRPDIFLAGQITGVEGYVESAACGLWVGILLAARLTGRGETPPPPPETCFGGLLRHLQTEQKNFQPANVQFGLMPELGMRAKKKDRKLLYANRAQERFADWLASARDRLA